MNPPAALQALVAQAQAKAQGKPLPRLRDDLVISPGPRSPAGAPTWLIYDPLRHRFIDIDAATFEVLSLWRNHTTVESLAFAVALRNGQPANPD